MKDLVEKIKKNPEILLKIDKIKSIIKSKNINDLKLEKIKEELNKMKSELSNIFNN